MAPGSRLGVRFLQLGSGSVRAEGGSGLAADHFALRLAMQAASLWDFLDCSPHRAEVRPETSYVTWRRGEAEHRLAVLEGHMVMFRQSPTDRRHRFYDLDFTFEGPDGRLLRLTGQKDLHDDGVLDVWDAARDLSRIQHATFLDVCTGQVVARGQLSVHLDETLEELEALEVTGTQDPVEQRDGKRAFAAWMNRELAEVYDALPLVCGHTGYLSWPEQTAVLLLAEVMLPEGAGVAPAEVLRGIERFLEDAHAPLVEKVRPALAAVGALGGLLRLDPVQLRRECDELLHGGPGLLRDALELVHAMVTVPYYAHPRGQSEVGYAPLPRPPLQRPPRPALPLASGPRGTYDVLVAGSGPAGSLLAQRLTRDGQRVLLLEAGGYHRESALETDDLAALAQLYREGGLQRAEDRGEDGAPLRSFPVLQGQGLGGGSLVNNAVCFRLPPEVERHWREACGFPVTSDALARAYSAVAGELGIRPVSEVLAPGARANPAHALLRPALGERLQECWVSLERSSTADAETGCVGCGRCNLGCTWERKRNALAVYLPQATATGGLDILTHVALERLVTASDGQVVHALVRFGRGGELAPVSARRYVLACGPIASSRVLHRTSGLTQSVRERVGERFSANVGSPVHAFLRAPVHAGHALPMAHFHQPAPGAGYVVETWFNPPASQSLAMPGFLDAHAARMRRYAHLAAAGALVGAAATGRVHESGRVELPLAHLDLLRLHRGVAAIARAFLAPDNAGQVEEVLVSTRLGEVLRSAADVQRFEEGFEEHFERAPGSLRALTVGTGHPQGGNCMSSREELGVVDADFRVRGLKNLYVADSSLFPASATVNPQWTTLALAHLCAEHLTA